MYYVCVYVSLIVIYQQLFISQLIVQYIKCQKMVINK